ncbi:hypothetical protein LshimejAT787_0103900 [Lyophyllum shimeji]|uniref:Uncharacterized protein n=1 Tax=Lyophyllum shimeji TaxID=47721 RepID=A0A9P3UHX2_LYOSH|nr:hypothetical protein LshimejAT787_0103160 [Lyophyllum shimeji]GLB33506.1 hypothetical protein LshimejAT787_0103900 [Lyophyllum shimeji]
MPRSPEEHFKISSFPSNIAPTVTHDVKLNRQTTLSTLYTYNDVHAYVEYPETGSLQPVGHLFRRDPKNWQNPAHEMGYSMGFPSGRTQNGHEVFNPLLKDSAGALVPCTESHFTCQGSKICPKADLEKLSTPHTSASREDVRLRLLSDRSQRLAALSPQSEVFRNTAALIAALRNTGCRAPQGEETHVPAEEMADRELQDRLTSKAQRGYMSVESKCGGRLVLHDDELNICIKCEHYSKYVNRDHYIQFIDESRFDFDYIKAYFDNDKDELERIERSASDLGVGPLRACTTVTNFSAQKVCCPFDHRLENGSLVQPEMIHLPCQVKFRSHPHPVPLPQKTPPVIRAEIMALLDKLGGSLADLTTRRFLRHPVVRAYLADRFPSIPSPSLSDLHVSLSNREHVKVYIDQAITKNFPYGTGWEGLLHLKKVQDETLQPEDHYIRKAFTVKGSTMAIHEEDERPVLGDSHDVRIIICMTKEGSRRLLNVQYPQSDIGFKRVVGFYEFELACWDRIRNMSVVFCRVFVTRQTAAVHQLIFEALDDIVKLDTGHNLRWRHIHASSPEDTDGLILQWGADQHSGQAKGLGLYLQKIAQQYPMKYDLHEPHRLLKDLSPYEHLHRIFRLCFVHFMRNIRACSVPEEVRNLMRGLCCMTHDNWDGTLNKIQALGGKPAIDWVQNKVASKFAFEAICWERSYIPKAVWVSGDSNTNLVESVHADVNREGVGFSLVGAVKAGQRFDALTMKTLQDFETAGIRPSYQSGHPTERATRGVKRKFTAHHNTLVNQDAKIDDHNKRIRKASLKVSKHEAEAARYAETLSTTDVRVEPQRHADLSQALAKSQMALGKAREAYAKVIAGGKGLLHTGTGKVLILMPVDEMATMGGS